MREKERNREKKGENERKQEKRCPGPIIINLHSICTKKKISMLAEMFKI